MTSQKVAGWLEKKPDKGLVRKWKKRWFVLKGTELSYYNSDKDKEKAIDLIDLTKMQSCSANKDAGEGAKTFGFNFTIPGRTYHLRASTESARSGWVERLKQFVPVAATDKGPSQKELMEEEVDLSSRSLTEFPMGLLKNPELKVLNLFEK